MANTTLQLNAPSTTANPKRRRWRLLWITLLLPVAAVGLWGGLRAFSPHPSQSAGTEPRSLPARISALGRLAPEGEVISIAPPTQTGTLAGARVEQLFVDVGDEIKAGQVVAILDSNLSRAAAVLEAKAKVEVAKAKLAQVNAGPKPEEVRTQEAVIRRSEADLVAAQEDFERASRLVLNTAIAREEYSARRSRFEQARATLEQNKAQLEAIKAIRQVDIKAAEADVAQAEATLTVSLEDLRSTEVRAPLGGQVLRIRTRPGERVGDSGIMELGNTKRMQIVAEVYEEDIGKVSVGQPAKIRVPTLGVELSGVVVGKDLVVSRKVVFSNDPVADIDARVVEVRIHLSSEDGARVAGLSNARAEVVIDVSRGTK